MGGVDYVCVIHGLYVGTCYDLYRIWYFCCYDFKYMVMVIDTGCTWLKIHVIYGNVSYMVSHGCGGHTCWLYMLSILDVESLQVEHIKLLNGCTYQMVECLYVSMVVDY